MRDRTFDRIEALETYARERGITLLDVAIGGLAAQPAVGSVIAGATRPEQVKANAAAGELGAHRRRPRRARRDRTARHPRVAAGHPAREPRPAVADGTTVAPDVADHSPPLGGRYELRRQLAATPAARVYLAQDLELGRPVAIKVLGPDLARDPQIVERFRQAANTAASVHDPRIVTIYDWGDDQGAVYVAMELRRRPEPRRHAARDAQRLGIDRTINVGIGVAQALDAAHRSGLVHGSLTPARRAARPATAR